MKLPSDSEINPHPGYRSGERAVKMFSGKTLEEAEGLFREDSLSRQEDLMQMGPIGFVFYFPAALRYLKSPRSSGDSSFASSMTGLLEWRVLGQYEDYYQIRPARTKMIEFCNRLIEHYAFYNIDIEIYGDLRPRLEKLLDKLQAERPWSSTGAAPITTVVERFAGGLP